jgi:iron(III) transport system permease protein
MPRRLTTRLLVVGAATSVFVVATVLPLLYVVVQAIAGSGFGPLLLDARQRTLLYNTALLGAGAAAFAVLLGVPLGLGLARLRGRYTAPLRVALAAPVLLPPYIVGLAWTYIGSVAGIAATVAGRDLLSGWTYSLSAAAAVLALVYYPVVMLATEVTVRQIDPHLEESGLITASPARVLMHITLPVAAPAIAGAALIVFVLAVSEFGVPGLLRVRVYTTEVFTAFAALYDFGRATVLTLPLLFVTGAMSAVAAMLLSSRVIASRRRGHTVEAFDSRVWRWPVLGLAIATFVTAVVIPTVVLVREASGTSIAAVAAGSWPSVRASLALATVGATLVVVVGAWLGYARARASSRLGSLTDVLCIVLFAVPSTVVGVALIGMWNRPGIAGLVYGTAAMLVLAYLARFLPVATLIIAAAVRQVPVSQEQASAVAGATWLRTVTGIVAPQVTRGLAAVWFVVFVFAFGELGASVLVSPPGESTLPIRIYTIIANTPSSVVAALALFQVGVIFVPLALAGLYLTRRASL